MGLYLNPGNEAFRQIINGEYIDKTGLIAYMNQSIGTIDNLTCVTRPRRFGKSYAAMMLAAYYDCSCDSQDLFDDLNISKIDSYLKHMNQYDVVYLDISQFASYLEEGEDLVEAIQLSVIRELREKFGDIIPKEETVLARAMIYINQKTKKKFIIIIDEWDVPLREEKTDIALQKKYINLLRGLFKGGPATKVMIAAAYMTGILPIKKYGTQSALTDFIEYTMIDPGKLAEYIGFTEMEVKELCNKHHMDYQSMRQWYDGYSFTKEKHIYSPNSVMKAIKSESYHNYWTKSETYESLRQYISMNFDGLKDAVISMLGGQEVFIDTITFQNDMVSLKSRNDVLTLLIHLGYLAYDEEKETVHIPNLEVAEVFKSAVQSDGWGNVGKALEKSNKLLLDTLSGNEAAVAEALDEIHSDNTSILQYNNENSLSCVITLAYYAAKKEYKIIREFPTGKGFADLVFLPYKNTDWPALIIELKYDKSASTAITQIKEKRYDGILKDYVGEVALVGINYDKSTKKHECIIERK